MKSKRKIPLHEKPVHDVSTEVIALTDPQGMGGIIGGNGYDFQTRYIVTKIPEWLTDVSFSELLHEGTGDVDIRFGTTAHHIQLKDHSVSCAEFGKVVKAFFGWNKSKPGVYGKFVLACPGLDKKVLPLKNELERIRGANKFYLANGQAMDPELSKLRTRIARLGLAHYADFILEKVHFEDSGRYCHDDAIAKPVFLSKLQTFRDYAKRLHDTLAPSYSILFSLVTAHRAKVLGRLVIEQTIESEIVTRYATPTEIICIDVHNWAFEKYDQGPHHVLDWTKHFDRLTRRVPDADVCGNVLLPEMQQLANNAATSSAIRTIRFRGRCCLTVGLALGATFSEPSGWVFEVQQPQMLSAWRSNSTRSRNYPAAIVETALEIAADAIVFVFDVTGRGVTEVQDYILESQISAKALVVVEPSGGSGGLSISNGEEAASLALIAKDLLKACHSKYKVRKTHLFFYGPIGLAIFLGQKLTSIGEVHLYEYQNPGYVKTFTLKT